MSTPVVEAIGLKRYYQLGAETVHALDGVDVTIHQGEFVAIMGASGSGKSTFMNMCSALDQPTEGIVRVAGEDLSSMNRDALADLRNRVIGFVFQQFNLLPRTTALQNVMLPLRYAGISGEEAAGRCKRALEAVDLAERMDHQPSELSGGQQQRVAIARALVTNPTLIFADEPTGALDSATSKEVLELFQRLNREGMTIVMVTHDSDVAAHAQRCLTFRDGKIIEDSALQERACA